jgi:hypothetical protein
MTRTQLQGMLKDVPNAMRPGWLERTWSGAHGTGELNARVATTESYLELHRDALSGTSQAKGFVDLDGSQVGRFTRDLRLHPNGRLEVHHSWLKLDAEAHGTGFARGFNDQAFARYAQAGVDDVTIHAALTVGGYAWARQGFELVGEGVDDMARAVDRAAKVTRLVDRARQRLDPAEFARLDQRLYRGGPLRPDALTSVQELAALPVGKSILVGSSWHGARPIERSSTWWDGRSAGGATDIARGVSHLEDPDRMTDVTRDAAHRIAAHLPAALDPATVTHAFESRMRNVGGGHVIDADGGPATRISLLQDTPGRITTEARLRTDGGEAITFNIQRAPDDEIHGVEYLPETLAGLSTKRAFASAWRELGVTDVERRHR